MTTRAATIQSQVPSAPAKTGRPVADLQRKCACGESAGFSGACEACRGKKLLGKPLQTKLRINEPGDPYEQEADRVAEQVMRMPDPSVTQRSQARHAHMLVQRRTASGNNSAMEAPQIVHDVLNSPGQPLDAATRAFFEPRFAHDFSQVRVHSDSRAARSAKEVHALAYTAGNHLVFGDGRYSPNSLEGRALLAHELTHVAQSESTSVAQIRRSVTGCQELLSVPAVASIVSGSLVHRIIATHFLRAVQGATTVLIPGASAGPQRSQGLCGEDDKVINPQMVGGMSGAGFPDLSRITQGGILQVAEIKPATIPCLVDGEIQALRYIDQGNAQDAQQAAWRTSLGVKVVSPMPSSAYSPPVFMLAVPSIGKVELRTAWCTDGLLAYTVSASGLPVPVRVPRRVTKSERDKARDKLKEEAADNLVPVAVAAGATAVAAIAGRALWRHFWMVVIKRFAVRGTIAAALSVADGPLPFGELVSLGLAVLTVIDIIKLWPELWEEADKVAASGA